MKLKALDQIQVTAVQSTPLKPGQEFEIADAAGAELVKRNPRSFAPSPLSSFATAGEPAASAERAASAEKAILGAPKNKAEGAPPNKAEPKAKNKAE